MPEAVLGSQSTMRPQKGPTCVPSWRPGLAAETAFPHSLIQELIHIQTMGYYEALKRSELSSLKRGNFPGAHYQVKGAALRRLCAHPPWWDSSPRTPGERGAQEAVKRGVVPACGEEG